MKAALFVSPHLDDVAFSCGGTVARLAARGWHCVLATVFTRSVAQPSGFALACQTDKGLAPHVDYMRLRRDEDAAFARIAGVASVHWLDFAEAPHRGYGSAAALFTPPRHDEEVVVAALVEHLQALCDSLRPALLFAPLGLGRHVDHVQVRAAVERMPRRPPTLWYRDMPYAMRAPDERETQLLANAASSFALQIGEHLGTKLDGCAAYRSQLGFQFGGEDGMRDALARSACRDGAAIGRDGPVERFTVQRGA